MVGLGHVQTCTAVDILKVTLLGQNHYIVDADWDVLDGVQMGATWRIRLNRPCAAAMGSYVRLLSPVYIFLQYYRVCYYALWHCWFGIRNDGWCAKMMLQQSQKFLGDRWDTWPYLWGIPGLAYQRYLASPVVSTDCWSINMPRVEQHYVLLLMRLDSFHFTWSWLISIWWCGMFETKSAWLTLILDVNLNS